MTAAAMEASAQPADLARSWSSWLPVVMAGGIGFWIMHKYGGMKKMEEMVKELDETRVARDAAIATATQALTLVSSLTAIETLLREKLKASEDALKKERDESMEAHHKDFEARQNLEKANEHWKQKHADLEVKYEKLERQHVLHDVDGWWDPEDGGSHTLKGTLVGYIGRDHADELKTNMLVFELTEPCDGCKNSDASALERTGSYTAAAGQLIGVPEWNYLVGLWPKKSGHLVFVTRGAVRKLGKGRRMYDTKVQVSKTKKKRGTIWGVGYYLTDRKSV